MPDRILAVLAHAALGQVRAALFADPTAAITLTALVVGAWIAAGLLSTALLHLWHRAVARPPRVEEPEWLPDDLPATPEEWGLLHDLETDFHAPSAPGHQLPRRDARPRRISRQLPMRPVRRTQTKTRKVR
jgi:hypothetical protein